MSSSKPRWARASRSDSMRSRKDACWRLLVMTRTRDTLVGIVGATGAPSKLTGYAANSQVHDIRSPENHSPSPGTPGGWTVGAAKPRLVGSWGGGDVRPNRDQSHFKNHPPP